MDDLKLDGPAMGRLHAALVSAFPTWTALAMMLKYNLDADLTRLAGGPDQDMDAVVFTLLQKTEAQGRLRGLIAAALERSPNNAELQKFAPLLEHTTSRFGPQLLVTDFLEGELTLTTRRVQPSTWTLSLSIYIDPFTEDPLIIPAHRCGVSVIFAEDKIVTPEKIRINKGIQARVVEADSITMRAEGRLPEDMVIVEGQDAAVKVMLSIVKMDYQIFLRETLSWLFSMQNINPSDEAAVSILRWQYTSPPYPAVP